MSQEKGQRERLLDQRYLIPSFPWACPALAYRSNEETEAAAEQEVAKASLQAGTETQSSRPQARVLFASIK